MVGGRLQCSNCLVMYGALLLLQVFLHDVEASSCPRIIHKKVGDAVELPSCSSAENVTALTWKLNNALVVDKGASVVIPTLFRDRVSLNPTNFSLTVRKLTLQDSGNFTFISAVNDKQRPSVHITLQVHEPLTKEPVLTFNSTWDVSTKSCTVLLECRSTSDSRVSYNWTVRKQTLNGSRLQYKIRPEDGDTTFTCTISNFISDKSASQTVKCSNNTSEPPGSRTYLGLLRIIGFLPFTVLLLLLLHYTKSKDKCCNRLNTSNSGQTVDNMDETGQHVYSSHGDGCVFESVKEPTEVEKVDTMERQEEKGL